VDDSAIVAFVNRPWRLVEEEKVRARAERYRAGGSGACFAAAQELRRRYERLHPEGSHVNHRQEDLAAHVHLARTFAAIADGLARR
jgi:hypothetical protein